MHVATDFITVSTALSYDQNSIGPTRDDIGCLGSIEMNKTGHGPIDFSRLITFCMDSLVMLTR